MHFLFYFLIGFVFFIIDRITKFIALKKFGHEYVINSYLSFQLVFNRGISWGLFYYSNEILFFIVNFIICFIILYLLKYTYMRFMQNYTILGETFVLSGALSNLFDRFYYGGVIDFIEFHYRQWYFPTFNIADSIIFLGVLIMIFYYSRYDYQS